MRANQGPRRRKVLRLYGQGHILGFHIAVAAPLILEAEYPRRVLPDGVQVVPWGRMPNRSSSGPCSTYRLLSDICTPMVGS